MTDSTSTHYELCVRGVLGDAVLGAFPALTATTDDGDTLLVGGALDQAALHGALRQVEALGLELLFVRRVGCPDAPASADRPSRMTRVTRFG